MTTPEPLAFPTDPAGWTAFATERPTAAVAVVADVDARLVAGTDLDAAARLELWNDAEIALLAATNESYLLSEAHPDAAVRAIAEEQVQRLDPLAVPAEALAGQREHPLAVEGLRRLSRFHGQPLGDGGVVEGRFAEQRGPRPAVAGGKAGQHGLVGGIHTYYKNCQTTR